LLVAAYDDACGLLDDIDRLVEFQRSIVGLWYGLSNMVFG
jgi:hypothetical protein